MKKYVLKIIALAMIVVLALEGASVVFLRWFKSQNDADNSSFYDLEENSLDVILVGSSHIYCGFGPTILRDEFGLDGYDLASPNQNATCDYLYAKNAYKTQKYKVLVVDANSMYTVSDEDYFLFNNLRSISSMYPQEEYFEYIKFLNNKKSGLKFIFPVTILHDKWKEVVSSMFTGEYAPNEEARGFMAIEADSKAGEEHSETVIKYDTNETEDIDFTAYNLMKEFCNENGILMIVVKSVQTVNDGNKWDDVRHNTIQNWCDSNGVTFLDFNTPELIEETGLVITEDVAEDLRHANVNGAIKETRYLGKVITEILNEQ